VDPDREIALSGRRVLAPGGAIVAAVDEALRYATKQAGYHGGASAAEAVIPVIVLSRTPDDLRAAGWVPAAPQAPAWWNDALAAGTSAIPVTVSAPAPKRPAPAAPGQGLLDMDIPDDVPATTGPSLVDELLASPIYQAQKARAGARGADDATVSAAVDVLLTHAGRVHRDTLAAAAGIPSMRIPTTLTALRRQLNVEGYDVLYVDVDQVTVVLDVPLLRQQFLEDL
jgi:hypothetical protein